MRFRLNQLKNIIRLSNNIIIYILLLFSLFSCKNRNEVLKTHIVDEQGNILGDSIFVDGLIRRIIFTDTLLKIDLKIDSIIFDYWKNDTVKSKYTFKNGHKVFENIEFYEDGEYKSYKFFSSDRICLLEKEYNEYGRLIKLEGAIISELYIDGLNMDNNTVILGTTVRFHLFLPNLPNCKIEPYIVGDSIDKWYVFGKSDYLDYLHITYKDHPKSNTHYIEKWSKIRICYDVQDQDADTSFTDCLTPIWYKIVSENDPYPPR